LNRETPISYQDLRRKGASAGKEIALERKPLAKEANEIQFPGKGRKKSGRERVEKRNRHRINKAAEEKKLQT